MDDLDDDLEAIFIDETLHKTEPIREKPVKNIIEKVWIKKKKKSIKLCERFAKLIEDSQQRGFTFEDDDEDEEEDNDDNNEDIDATEDTLNANEFTKNPQNRKLLLSLAQKLKRKSICNRLGMTYNPAKNRLRDGKTRLGTSKSWSEKFGKLLAAKKLLHLPLLYKKYRSGPRMSKKELDIEIDLYMAEVKKICSSLRKPKQKKNSELNGMNGYKIGDKYCTGPQKSKEELDEEIDRYMAEDENCPDLQNIDIKQELDEEMDLYMADKKCCSGLQKSKQELDFEMDAYMAETKKSIK